MNETFPQKEYANDHTLMNTHFISWTDGIQHDERPDLWVCSVSVSAFEQSTIQSHRKK